MAGPVPLYTEHRKRRLRPMSRSLPPPQSPAGEERPRSDEQGVESGLEIASRRIDRHRHDVADSGARPRFSVDQDLDDDLVGRKGRSRERFAQFATQRQPRLRRQLEAGWAPLPRGENRGVPHLRANGGQSPTGRDVDAKQMDGHGRPSLRTAYRPRDLRSRSFPVPPGHLTGTSVPTGRRQRGTRYPRAPSCGDHRSSP